MPVYLGHGRRVLFVHIPKTGGTSLEHAFRRSGFEQTYLSREFGEYGCRPQHMAAADLVTEFPGLPFDYVFCVVRDPVARLRSERRWRADHERRKGISPPDLDTWVKGWLDRTSRRPTVGDNHFRRQVDFLVPGIEVMRFEDGLAEVLSKVAQRLRIPTLNDLPEHRMRSTAEVDTAVEEITAEARQRLLQRYLVDFAVFDYPVPDYLSAALAPDTVQDRGHR